MLYVVFSYWTLVGFVISSVFVFPLCGDGGMKRERAGVEQIALYPCTALRLRCLSVPGSEGPFQQFVMAA